MKRATLVILATLSLAATSVVAQSRPPMTVNVPFNFVAGAKTLPAGEYQVQTDGLQQLVWIRSADLKTTLNLIPNSVEDAQMNGVAALKFNRYGDRYFLSQIWTGSNLGKELPRTRAEREQIATTGPFHAVVALTAER
jgi:hypothetical protein